jgi:hypothetical protein
VALFAPLHVPNQVLAAGFSAGSALVRPILLIFSICDCPFLIRMRWSRQHFKVKVALLSQHHDPLGDLSTQLLGRRIGANAVDGVGLLEVLDGDTQRLSRQHATPC